MPNLRYNDDLWLKFETAKVLSETSPNSMIEIKDAAVVRIGFWRTLLREAEKEVAKPPVDPARRRFTDPRLEARRVKEALADALELDRQVEHWLSSTPKADEQP
jgi:hypothetical protein